MIAHVPKVAGALGRDRTEFVPCYPLAELDAIVVESGTASVGDEAPSTVGLYDLNRIVGITNAAINSSNIDPP